MRELVQWTKLFAYANETYESKNWRRPLGLIKDQKNKTGFKFQRSPRGHGILAPLSEIESKDEEAHSEVLALPPTVLFHKSKTIYDDHPVS